MRAFNELPLPARAALRDRVVKARARENHSRVLFRELGIHRVEDLMRVAPDIFDDVWPHLASMPAERRLTIAEHMFGDAHAEEALSVCDRLAAQQPANGVAA